MRTPSTEISFSPKSDKTEKIPTANTMKSTMTYNRELTALFTAAFRFDVDLILSDINKTIRKKL